MAEREWGPVGEPITYAVSQCPVCGLPRWQMRRGTFQKNPIWVCTYCVEREAETKRQEVGL